jgi:DNA-binding IclR family transcriptional regulator
MHIVTLIRRKKRVPTTGHGQPVGDAPPIFTGTRSKKTAPISSPTGARSTFSRRRRSPETENTAESRAELRAEAAKRRVEGYEWLFEG